MLKLIVKTNILFIISLILSEIPSYGQLAGGINAGEEAVAELGHFLEEEAEQKAIHLFMHELEGWFSEEKPNGVAYQRLFPAFYSLIHDTNSESFHNQAGMWKSVVKKDLENFALHLLDEKTIRQMGVKEDHPPDNPAPSSVSNRSIEGILKDNKEYLILTKLLVPVLRSWRHHLQHRTPTVSLFDLMVELSFHLQSHLAQTSDASPTGTRSWKLKYGSADTIEQSLTFDHSTHSALEHFRMVFWLVGTIGGDLVANTQMTQGQYHESMCTGIEQKSLISCWDQVFQKEFSSSVSITELLQMNFFQIISLIGNLSPSPNSSETKNLDSVFTIYTKLVSLFTTHLPSSSEAMSPRKIKELDWLVTHLMHIESSLAIEDYSHMMANTMVIYKRYIQQEMPFEMTILNNLIVSLAGAEDADGIAKAFFAASTYMDPWKKKRKVNRSTSLNLQTFVGIWSGTEYRQLEETEEYQLGGVWLPIGLEVNWPSTWIGSWGAFFQIVDFGGLIEFNEALNNEMTGETSTELQFQHVFAPGFYLVAGLPVKYPLTFGIGAQMMPYLREALVEGERQFVSTMRFQVFFAADFTLLDL